MNPRRIDVFFYGLFMETDALRAMGARPANPRIGRVDGFALRIGRRATLTPESGSQVYGIVTELTHAEIQLIYSEPGVHDYRPEAVTVELDDGTGLPALCFMLPKAPGAEEVNQEYARRLRDLALRLGLPPGYVNAIA